MSEKEIKVSTGVSVIDESIDGLIWGDNGKGQHCAFIITSDGNFKIKNAEEEQKGFLILQFST